MRAPPASPAVRSRDPTSFEYAHSCVLRDDPATFKRRIGKSESYVEQAAESSDLLVWQRTQDRDEDCASPLQTLRPRSRVDYYDTFRVIKDANYVGAFPGSVIPYYSS